MAVPRSIARLAIASSAGLRKGVMLASSGGSWLQEYAAPFAVFRDAAGAPQPSLASSARTTSNWSMKSHVSPSAISPIVGNAVASALVSSARRPMIYETTPAIAAKSARQVITRKTMPACPATKSSPTARTAN
jgi:hypothetical protein